MNSLNIKHADKLLSAAYVLAMLGLLSNWQGFNAVEPNPIGVADSQMFRHRVDVFTKSHQIGVLDYLPLVQPKPGQVVPILAQPFSFTPNLQLVAGETYHLEVFSADGVHSLAIDGQEVLLHPGQVWRLTVTAKPGMRMVCNEYCGLGHAKMRQAITVIEKEKAP